MIDRTSPIVGRSTADAHDALVWLGESRDEVHRYALELDRLCDLVGFDFRILFAQAVHETGRFTSKWWTERLNPAGIGITGDATQNEQSHTWKNGTEAARAHVVHMMAYTGHYGGLPAETIADLMDLDPRFDAVNAAGYAGTVRTLGDLGNGKWATDPQYADKIAARANQIFKDPLQGDDPMADLTFGKVPYPAVTARHLPIENNWVKSGAPAVPEAVVWHRMIGTLWGTDEWFFGDHAATAYGVGVVSIDGQDDAGRIIEWMSPASGYYGESSGPANGPYGDGAKLIQRVGLDYNRVTKAIEISGEYATPLDEPARASVVNLTAYFADQARIPWDQFPNVPGQDRSFVCWHQEICGPAEKACPGVVVMNETSALIQRVSAVLKRYQGSGGAVVVPPKYAASDLPDWFADAVEQTHPTDNRDGALRYNAIRRNFVVTHATRRLSKPDGKAERSGPNVAVGEKVFGEYQTSNGFIVTTDGHYLATNRLSPRVTFRS